MFKKGQAEVASKFTSHYVTINSNLSKYPILEFYSFTSHYVTINSSSSTVILTFLNKFTSHYVTINSHLKYNQNNQNLHLHPTM